MPHYFRLRKQMVRDTCVVVAAVFAVSALYASDQDQAAKDAIVAQALLRLENVDLETVPQARESLLRHLRSHPESDEFLILVKKFQLAEMSDLLTILASKSPDSTKGVEAARLLLEFRTLDEIQGLIRQAEPSPQSGAALLSALARTDAKSIGRLALEYATSTSTEPSLRRAAITAAGRSESGKRELLQLLEDGKFGEEFHVALASVLLSSPPREIHQAAAELLKLPATASKEPVPPLSQLVNMRGNAVRGGSVFRDQGTCIKCHQIGTEGKQVGPNLSEIGSKLAREALYVSILDPNAAISFNYETNNVLLADGREVTGILVSETDESITIKTAEAIERTINRVEIDEVVPQKVSLMPVGLVQNMTTQQLVDLVEYLLSLKTS